MVTIPRRAHLEELSRKLRDNPVVALLGARQVGKTTLARKLATRRQHAPRVTKSMVSTKQLLGLSRIDVVQRHARYRAVPIGTPSLLLLVIAKVIATAALMITLATMIEARVPFISLTSTSLTSARGKEMVLV